MKERIIETCTAGRYILGGDRIEAVRLNDKIKGMLLGEKKKAEKRKIARRQLF